MMGFVFQEDASPSLSGRMEIYNLAWAAESVPVNRIHGTPPPHSAEAAEYRLPSLAGLHSDRP